ncbi:MAG: tetratricopeptide repeat protein [Candidatus Hydrogenedentes bacterium]|nr:tetratricopeptide repeat protein [Candidatus Hydrogenedentota bacterium]
MTEEQPTPIPAERASASTSPKRAAAPEGVLKGERGIEAAQVGISAFLIVVMGFIAYSNVFRVPFQGLDLTLLRNQPAMHRVATAPQAFESLPAAPLTVFSYALNWQLTPERSPEFHLINLLLHLANGVLIYLICRRLVTPRLPEPLAMLAGMLFVVHPLTTEPVAYLVGRPMLLGADNVSMIAAAISLGCYAFAVAASFSLLLLPLAFLALDSVANGARAVAKHWRLHSLYLAGLLALAVAILASQTEAPFPPPEAASAVAVFSHLCLRFVSLALTPFHLTPLWPGLEALSTAWTGFGVFLLLVAAAAITLLFRTALGAALLWSLAALAGAALLLPAEHAHSERGLYIALAGLLLALPWLFSILTAPLARRAAGVAAALLVVAATWQTFVRVLDWQEPQALWEAAAEQAPESPTPSRYIAQYIGAASAPEQRQEAMAMAAEYWQRVLELAPDDVEALTSLGMALYVQQKPAEAAEKLEAALRNDPFNQQASLYLALSLDAGQSGQPDVAAARRAYQYYRRALELGPLPAELLGRAGMSRLVLGDFKGALPLLSVAANSQPESPLAATVQQLGRVAERMQQLEQQAQEMLAKNPRDFQAAALRAESKLLRGDTLGAFYLLDRVLHRAPEQGTAWALMGAVRARMGSPEAFLREWGGQQASPEAWRQLAQRTAGSGAWPAALSYLEYHAQHDPAAAPARLVLADIAVELQQPRIAEQYLHEAAEQRPEDPAPWLKLADIALAAKNTPEVQRLLGEAQKRNAPEEEIKKRSEAAGGVTPDAAAGPQRTIIR